MKMLLVALVAARNFRAFAARWITLDQSKDRMTILTLPCQWR